MTDKIICRVLTGPTASGKSELSVRLALDQGWDIISMDSMQIYRRMNIGTAKPTLSEMKGVGHHMIDICEPTQQYSVAEYRDTAEKILIELHEQKREALFVGGTMLYLQALMHPMGMGFVPANTELRDKLNCQAATAEGRKRLHERLKMIDPQTAERLPVNDVRRIIRAIEVWEATGIPFSEQPERETEQEQHLVWKVVSTQMDRTVLYDRINRRVSEMIHAGLKDEVEALIREGVPPEAQSMNGIGYKEMVPCIFGEYGLDDAAERIRTNTRHYAKRQMTFLRREEKITYIRTDHENAWDEIRRSLI